MKFRLDQHASDFYGYKDYTIALAPLAIIFGVKGLKAESDYSGLGWLAWCVALLKVLSSLWGC